MEMDCQFISIYGKFVTSQTASSSNAEITIPYRYLHKRCSLKVQGRHSGTLCCGGNSHAWRKQQTSYSLTQEVQDQSEVEEKRYELSATLIQLTVLTFMETFQKSKFLHFGKLAGECLIQFIFFRMISSLTSYSD